MQRFAKAARRFFDSRAEKMRFIIVGVLNTALDFTVLNILTSAVGLRVYTANLISTATAMLVSMFLNKTFVFQHDNRVTLREAAKFTLVTLTGLWGIQTLVILLVTQQFSHPFLSTAHMLQSLLGTHISNAFILNNGAKILATAASLVWNYTLYKRFVFVKKEVEDGK